jgi:hypothetical protein
MPRDLARAMYDQLEETLSSITYRHHPHGEPADAKGDMRTGDERMKSLAGCGDAASLRSAINELCAEFGKVTYVDVLTMAESEKRRALCFLRLESAAQERELMSALDVRRFGEDLVMIVDLARQPPAAAPQPRMQQGS